MENCIPKTFDDLPEEIGVEIFKKLAQGDLSYCHAVSKRWQDIIERKPELLRRVKSSFWGRLIMKILNSYNNSPGSSGFIVKKQTDVEWKLHHLKALDQQVHKFTFKNCALFTESETSIHTGQIREIIKDAAIDSVDEILLECIFGATGVRKMRCDISAILNSSLSQSSISLFFDNIDHEINKPIYIKTNVKYRILQPDPNAGLSLAFGSKDFDHDGIDQLLDTLAPFNEYLPIDIDLILDAASRPENYNKLDEKIPKPRLLSLIINTNSMPSFGVLKTVSDNLHRETKLSMTLCGVDTTELSKPNRNDNENCLQCFYKVFVEETWVQLGIEEKLSSVIFSKVDDKSDQIKLVRNPDLNWSRHEYDEFSKNYESYLDLLSDSSRSSSSNSLDSDDS